MAGAPSPSVSQSGTAADVRPACSSTAPTLDQAEPGTAVGLGHGDAEQPDLGELGPQLAVESWAVGPFQLTQPLVR